MAVVCMYGCMCVWLFIYEPLRVALRRCDAAYLKCHSSFEVVAANAREELKATVDLNEKKVNDQVAKRNIVEFKRQSAVRLCFCSLAP